MELGHSVKEVSETRTRLTAPVARSDVPILVAYTFWQANRRATRSSPIAQYIRCHSCLYDPSPLCDSHGIEATSIAKSRLSCDIPSLQRTDTSAFHDTWLAVFETLTLVGMAKSRRSPSMTSYTKHQKSLLNFHLYMRLMSYAHVGTSSSRVSAIVPWASRFLRRILHTGSAFALDSIYISLTISQRPQGVRGLDSEDNSLIYPLAVYSHRR